MADVGAEPGSEDAPGAAVALGGAEDEDATVAPLEAGGVLYARASYSEVLACAGAEVGAAGGGGGGARFGSIPLQEEPGTAPIAAGGGGGARGEEGCSPASDLGLFGALASSIATSLSLSRPLPLVSPSSSLSSLSSSESCTG